jgi:ABC-type transport system substrate-binding protein
LDPRGQDFGPNAENFHFDNAEARKLLSAAGFPEGLDADLHHAAPGPASYPPSYFAQAEALLTMVRDSGLFRLRDTPYDYARDWTPRIRNSRGAFTGAAWWPDVTSVDPAQALYATYNSKGGALFHAGDPALDDLTQKLITEFDTAARIKLAQDIQRHEGETMFQPKIGGASGFSLSWPCLRNVLVYQGGTNRMDATVFIDPDRAPLR